MLSVIENAIVAQLKAAPLPYLRTLATYGGEIDGDFAQMARQMPAIWIACKGEGVGKPRDTTRRRWEIPVSFLVLCAARNLRNEAVTRQGFNAGAALEIGTYQMLADVRSLLLQQKLGLPIEPLAPGRVRTLFSGKLQSQALSIYSQEWLTSYPVEVRDPNSDAGLPPDALRDGDGNLPPGQLPGAGVPGGTLPPLPPLPELQSVGLRYYFKPGDDEPDAVDLLTLQQGRPVGQP